MAKQNTFALLSVWDKTGIAKLGSLLHKKGYQIISTGGTAKVLLEHNIPIIPIEQITGNPESFDGRMKTISFQIESGILFDRSNRSHVAQAKALKILPISIVICNLYPFEAVVKDPNVSLKKAIEYIDVGGPTMVRAAAKNFKHVLVAVDPKDYPTIITCLEKGANTDHLRKELAAKAFSHLAFYDCQIARFLNTNGFSQEVTLFARKVMDLRYGENPHQKAALYLQPNNNSSLKHLTKISGRELSLVNVTDIMAGIESVRMFHSPCAVVIKHNSPCGIALGKNAKEALQRAIEADPESAFGGVVVLNTQCDVKAANVIASFKSERKSNMDIIAASTFSPKAIERLKQVRKTTGLYSLGSIPPLSPESTNLKWIDQGFILQTPDILSEEDMKTWKVVTKKKPTKHQMQQIYIAWKFLARIRSNAVIVVDQALPMTRGIGTGQTSRVRATTIALKLAGKHAKGGILGSDSFFPFADSVVLAAKRGISAIVQQGGSINDQSSIDAANNAGITMVFTGRRAFWH